LPIALLVAITTDPRCAPPRSIGYIRAGSRDRRDAHLALALSLFQLLVGLPYLLSGPGYILDDWFTLYWRWTRGVLGAAGPGQLRSRPGAWLTYLVEFGLVGRHPLVPALLLLVVAAATAALLYLVARRFVDRRAAAAITAIWIVLPDHSSLTRWASTLNIGLALLLVLAGALCLDGRLGRGDAAGTALLVAGALCYEAVLPLAAILTVVVPARRTGAWQPGRSALRLVPLVLTGGWMLSGTAHSSAEQGWFSFGLLYPAHFGWGLVPGAAGRILGVAALAAMAAALAPWLVSGLARYRRPAGVLVGAGLALVVAGALPFARDPIAPLGLGDRANVVGALGAAVAWAGICQLLVRRRVLLVATVAMLFIAWGSSDLRSDADFTAAGGDAAQILRAVGQTAAGRPAGTVVIGPAPRWHHGVVGLIGEEQEAVRVANHDGSLSARVATGPADFEAADPRLRLDLRAVPR
jgi:hypothetical protein